MPDTAEQADTTETSLSAESAIEAILLTTDKPVAAAKLAEALSSVGIETTSSEIETHVEALNQIYESSGRAFRIHRVASGYRIMADAAAAAVLAAYHGARASTRLSRAALETLAIVAYRQPVTRAEIEAIRGVAAGEVLRALMERKLITITGRAEELGRPMLYGTTSGFLAQFGLAKLGDLPAVEGTRPAESTQDAPRRDGPSEDQQSSQGSAV
ncbi:MAG: SMC-Scp complex subunit ScpB [Planctomycetota bacterium]